MAYMTTGSRYQCFVALLDVAGDRIKAGILNELEQNRCSLLEGLARMMPFQDEALYIIRCLDLPRGLPLPREVLCNANLAMAMVQYGFTFDIDNCSHWLMGDAGQIFFTWYVRHY